MESPGKVSRICLAPHPVLVIDEELVFITSGDNGGNPQRSEAHIDRTDRAIDNGVEIGKSGPHQHLSGDGLRRLLAR